MREKLERVRRGLSLIGSLSEGEGSGLAEHFTCKSVRSESSLLLVMPPQFGSRLPAAKGNADAVANVDDAFSTLRGS